MAKYGVTVNCISPTADTRMTQRLPEDRKGQAMAPPEGVAAVVTFLASDRAAHITGQVIGVRGNEITLYSHPAPVRQITSREPWTPEAIADVYDRVARPGPPAPARRDEDPLAAARIPAIAERAPAPAPEGPAPDPLRGGGLPMTQFQDAQLSPEIVLGEMTKNGVTHVVWLPDSETNFLYQLTTTSDQLEDFQASIASILGQPGPVFVALKVLAEVENVPIGQRPRWQTRTRDRVLADLRAELGISR